MTKIWMSFYLIISAFAVLFSADAAKSAATTSKMTSRQAKVVAAMQTGTYSADSIIVRNILDASGWTSTAVSDVSDSANGRIIHLYLGEMGISLSSEIGNLTALTVLELFDNGLTSLPAEIGNLVALTQLDLTSNSLASLPAGIGNLVAMSQLKLSNNNLTSLPVGIGNLVHLTQLELSTNNLTSLPTEIGNLSALNQLLVSYNNLSSLPTQIGNLVHLTQLDLSANNFTSLPTEIGNLSALNQLNLSYNDLTSLPTQIGNLTNLDTLFVDHNKLNDLPASIIGLSKLICLSVRFNRLCNLPVNIKEWAPLKNSNWQNSQGCQFPHDSIVVIEILKANNINNVNINSLVSVDSTGSVTQLTLDSMGITVIPDTIRALSSLTNLNLSNNALSELPGSVAQMASLKYMNLKNNKLTTLPGNIIYLKFPPDSVYQIYSPPGCPGGPSACDIKYLAGIVYHLMLDGNLLCNLPDSIQNWAMKYDTPGIQAQACNISLRNALKMHSAPFIKITQTQNNLLILGTSLPDEDLELQVITANGRLVRSEKLHGKAGQLSYVLSKSFLPKGMNIIQLSGHKCKYLLHTIVQ